MSRKSSYGQGHSAFCVWACLAGFLLTLAGCEDEPVKREYPRVRTLEVTNISENGATFVAEVYDEGNIAITEHGFAWSITAPDIDRSDRILLGSFTGTGRYDKEILSTLSEGSTYNVTAFVRAGEYTVYGETLKFISLGSMAPEVIDFQPHEAGWGDTITIFGKHFSFNPVTNRIMVGDQPATPFFSCDTVIKFFLPPMVYQPLNTVSVSIVGNVGTCAQKLTFIPPAVYGFTPPVGFWGDTITFTGRNLRNFGYSPTDGVLFNGYLSCIVISEQGNSVSFKIPGQLSEYTNSVALSLRTYGFALPETFTLSPPEADSISPMVSTWKSIVTLYGKFNHLNSMNSVLIDNVPAQVLFSSRDSIKVEVPLSAANPESVITYKSGPFTTTFDDKLRIEVPGPEIKYFTPAQGRAGISMKIGGKNFNPEISEVFIGGKKTWVINASDSVINCYVPGDIYGNCKVEVKMLSSTAEAAHEFLATNHRITSVSPLSINYTDIVTVQGEYFNDLLNWSIGDILIYPISMTPTEVKLFFPYALGYIPVKVKAVLPGSYPELTSTSVSEETLQVNDYVITNLGPLSGKPGDFITVSGTNFAVFREDAELRFGDVVAGINFTSPDQYIFVVPGAYEGDYQLTISFHDKSVVWPQYYSLTSAWEKLDDLTFLYDYGCVFDLGEDVYVATMETSPTDRSVYRFDPGPETFTKLPGIYVSQIKDPSATGLGGKGYLIGNKQDPSQIGFEVFNPDSLTWRTLPDYPGSFGESPWIVADDSVLYAGSGRIVSGYSTSYNEEFWKYSPITGKWSRLADLRYGSNPGKQAFINGKIHAIAPNDDFSRYDASSDSWDRFNELAPYQTLYFNGISVVMNGRWYVGYGDFYGPHFTDLTYLENFNDLMVFDPIVGSWSQVEYPGMSARSRVISFTIGNILYTGGDQNVGLYDFYKYDPLQDE